MKKSFFLITLLTLATTSFQSCKKKGCTDPLAVNYSDKAKKSDGTCTYQATFSLWWNETAANGLTADGAAILYLYMDGVIASSSSTAVYTTAAPNCESSGLLEYNADLGLNSTGTVNFQVIDDTGFEYWSGTELLIGGECNPLELVW